MPLPTRVFNLLLCAALALNALPTAVRAVFSSSGVFFKTTTRATPEGALGYSYDANGNVSTITSSNAGGTAVTYRYDDLNRLGEVQEGAGAAAEITSYGYDEVGNLAHFNTANGVVHAYSYNSLNRLTGLSTLNTQLSTIASYSYTQLRSGQRSAASEAFASTGGAASLTRTARYGYDALYRLTGETVTASAGPGGSVAYGLDPVGNRQSRTSTIAGVTTQAFTYDPNDRLTSDGYDANGNTTAGHVSLNAQGAEAASQTVTDTYDAENRLTTRTGPNSVQVIYDGDGNKVRETINGQTYSYLVDDRNPTGYAQVLGELQNGTVVRTYTYTYGHDQLLQDQRDGLGNWSATWYGYDGHGSVRLLTDGAGNVTDRYDYDAFGQLLHAEGTTYNRYRYCGEQYDSALGLYYLRARYLNAANGRFWNADSYEGSQSDPQSLHKYLYCNSDPGNRRDPSGYASLVEVMVTTAIRVSIGAITGAATGEVTGGLLGGYFHIVQHESFDGLWDSVKAGAVKGAIYGALIGGAGGFGPVGAAIALSAGFGVSLGDSIPVFLDPNIDVDTKVAMAMLLIVQAKVTAGYLPKLSSPNSLTTPMRANHILFGDETGGGHLFPGNVGKTPFPVGWSQSKILETISDIVTDPNVPWVRADGKTSYYYNSGQPARFTATTVRDGITIKVVVEPAGEGIITAHPVY